MKIRKNTYWYAGAILGICLAGGGYAYWTLAQEHAQLVVQQQHAQEEQEALNAQLQETQEQLAQTQAEKTELSRLLTEEQEKNNAFSDQINSITHTVSSLDKLSKTDPELLRKYSKIYFLNENYVPAHLSAIPSSYLLEEKKSGQILTEVLPHLTQLLEDARKASSTLYIASAYRSFADQYFVKSSYKMKFGTTAANSFSADQGYSEHQLGTTVDLTSREIGGALSGFDKTSQYAWLQQHAHEYGFILSYPKDNDYYQFEPWHWRFVGIQLATELYEKNMSFYDMDQREINSHLIHIFE